MRFPYSTSLFSLALATTLPHLGAATFHVAPGATGTGASWAQPANLQQALATASAGDSIFLRSGTYYPDEGTAQQNNLRSSAFAIPPGVATFGGFAGTESSPAGRTPATPASILSGDIDQDGTTAGNSYHIATITSTDTASPTTVLDRIQFTGGAANGPAVFHYRHRGGALRIVLGTTEITDCTFTGNTASSDGGAIANEGSAITYTRCDFTENTARRGGAIFATQSILPNGAPVPPSGTYLDTTFLTNTATSSGGAIASQFSTITLTRSTFSGNRANRHGGGIYVINELFRRARKPFIASDSTWDDNFAGFSGGGIYIDPALSATLSDCNFTDNRCNTNGGGLFFKDTPTEIARCTFTSNSARNGGGFAQFASDHDVTDSTFTTNSANHRGGAISNTRSTRTFQPGGTYLNTTFTGNSAGLDGGAISHIDQINTDVTRCTFTENTANRDGGALFIDLFARLQLTGCTINDNTARRDGGAVQNFSGTLTAPNSLFARNTAVRQGGALSMRFPQLSHLQRASFFLNAAFDGGAIHNIRGSGTALTSCLIARNSATSEGGAIYHLTSSPTFITNCTITENTAAAASAILSLNTTRQFELPGDTLPEATIEVANSILWENTDPQSPTGLRSSTASGLRLDAPIAFSHTILSSYTPAAGIDRGDNSASDPLFAPGGFTLSAASPAIDAGTSTAPLGQLDRAGNARISDGSGDGNRAPDLGAFEVILPDADSDADGFADTLEQELTGNPFNLQVPTLTATTTTTAAGEAFAFEIQSHPGLPSRFDFQIEQSTDIGRNDLWSPAPNPAPLNSERNFFRIRLAPK